LAKTLEVDKRVIFTGWLEKEDLWKIYVASDLFVLPSLSEGMPNSMLEALGAGLLCIGSNIPGIRDILEYDELTFDPHDENALFVKIYQLFSDQQFFHKIKKICQKRKDSFDFDWKEKVFEMITETPTSLIK
jgi:glycosyltransferase involved in cell wall biosynthesis